MPKPTIDNQYTLARACSLEPRQTRAILGAARAVVEADGPARDRGAHLLAVASTTLELGDNWRAHPAATPAELAAAFPTARARQLVIDALLIPACIETEVSAAALASVRSFAAGLGVRSHWLTTLGALHRRRVFAVQRQLFPRSPDGRRVLARTWAEEGLLGVVRALLFVLGLHRDRALAARFRALAQQPAGSLGHQLFTEFTTHNLNFPGERGGLPERMLHHDLMHVINGYATDPAGECELAGFYAGFADGDAFTFIVTALATFHLELPVSPAIVTPARGAFDPARVLAGFLRGRRLQVDVMGPWDYWALMPLPIATVREQLGIA